MQRTELGFFERQFERLLALLRANAFPFSAAMASGLLAHMFAITNKLPNADDIASTFNKGATVESGRWGLEVLKLIFPDYSMPWLIGITSLLLLASSVCVIIRLFGIKGRLKQAILGALVVSFPSQTAIMCYMFTSSCYAVGFLLSVLAAHAAHRGGRNGCIVSVLLTMFTLSIYQSNISIISSLLLLLVIKDALDTQSGESRSGVFRSGLKYLLILIAAMALYCVSIVISLKIIGSTLNDYSKDSVEGGPGLISGIGLAYYWFVYNLTSRYNMIVVSRFQRLMYFLSFLPAGVCLVYNMFKSRNLKNDLILLLCLILFPLSLCCTYVVISYKSIHALVLQGFFSLYILVLILTEQMPYKLRRIGGQELMLLSLTLIAATNIVFANRTYLKLHLQYESAYSISNVLLAQMRSLPGYNRELKLAIYKYEDQYAGIDSAFGAPEWDIMGVKYGLLPSSYPEQAFMNYYLDANIPVATDQEAQELAFDPRTADMPCYPDEGSMRIIDGYVFVKFRATGPADVPVQ